MLTNAYMFKNEIYTICATDMDHILGRQRPKFCSIRIYVIDFLTWRNIIIFGVIFKLGDFFKKFSDGNANCRPQNSGHLVFYLDI